MAALGWVQLLTSVPRGQCGALVLYGDIGQCPSKCFCRALIGAALTQIDTSSAMVDLLPEGPGREDQQISHLLQLRRFLDEPELAGALLAHRAGLAEQLVAGLAAAMKEANGPQVTEARKKEAICPWGLLAARGQVMLWLHGLPACIVLDCLLLLL